MIFFDTETAGFTGPAVLIQYAEDDNTVTIHDIWRRPVKETLALVRWLCNNEVCAFNLAFDWFHINKIYNLLSCLSRRQWDRPPSVEAVVAISESHSQAELTRYCLRPKRCLDLFLFSRKTDLQVLMDRRNIRIKRVPDSVAFDLVLLLNHQLKFDREELLFKKGYEWETDPIQGTGFSDVVLKFSATGGLKPLVKYLFKRHTLEMPIPEEHLPGKEPEYDPYNTLWKDCIYGNINYWADNKTARGYAYDDVEYLRELWEYWDRPQAGDTDSELAACVGAVRWKGYAIDVPLMQTRLDKANAIANLKGININAPLDCKQWLENAAETVVERIAVKNTDAKTLEVLSAWPGLLGERAKALKLAREAFKEAKLLSRLIQTGRLCPVMKVIGAKSGRMSGGSEFTKGDSINAQGIQHDPTFRKLFPLKDEDEDLSGGDFDAFEVTIAHAASRDDALRSDLETGKKFHAIFGQYLFDLPYEDVLASKGTDSDHYAAAKSSTFGIFYGAQPRKISQTAGVSMSKAESSIQELLQRYPDFAKFRQSIQHAFSSMQQPGGEGTAVNWHNPSDYVESLLGYRRYFTLENKVCRLLYELANGGLGFKPGPMNIERRKGRKQSVTGATQTALYSAAFQLQAANTRAALNHVIQSTGAELCKILQKKIWELQPCGIAEWCVRPMNMHDEIMVAHKPEYGELIEKVVKETVEGFKQWVPLVSMGWQKNLDNWAGKSGSNPTESTTMSIS